MHEYSITDSILKLAVDKASEAGAGKVTRINLVLGELSGIVDDCVRFYFDFLSRETVAAGAFLSFTKIPVKLRCRNCSREYLPVNQPWRCPQCHETGTEIISGRECHMESIEVE